MKNCHFRPGQAHPAVRRFVALIETHRFGDTSAWNAHRAALLFSRIAGSCSARGRTEVSPIGVATAYIH